MVNGDDAKLVSQRNDVNESRPRMSFKPEKYEDVEMSRALDWLVLGINRLADTRSHCDSNSEY